MMPNSPGSSVMGPVYTPVLKATGERLRFTSFKLERRDEVPWFVTDLSTGKRYAVTPKPCGLRCACDAWAEEVMP